MHIAKCLGIAVAALLTLALLTVGGYVAYMEATYYRIADREALDAPRPGAGPLAVGADYTALTYNIGFGAYTPDYTFFMDEGVMDDGTPTVGAHARAVSERSVRACTEGAIGEVARLRPDFTLLQEVDLDSDRSFHVNQREAFARAFPNQGLVWGLNFHSAFLAYPFAEPHGAVRSGLVTLSSFDATAAERRSYPIDQTFPAKYFDLDRCFTVTRLPVDNGRELVLINSHMSAYDKGGTSRARQLQMLREVLGEEAAKGNYVICGGDWNQALANSLGIYPSAQQTPAWVAVLDDADLPSGFSTVAADNLSDTPTCRGCDIPYQKGVTYTCTIDGFVVSGNVQATARNIDTGFAHSDHNPVLLTFRLKP
ncbi:endonuclease [Eggerthellaceae bacterium zg-1084]|uniref:endonuclease/exonuclease/phosphatase family protein n=1 Tax=Berryella wangjianweii TaxID=2734634 RepID=UPI00155376A5|nr:endonuclease/exonuclease/phosphatase family protein [Berryella wangjianweii]NPD31388.1 endonuclease [Berryella wangjianweii]NPD32305.1 endonuclease [Eggerthellaceae bacterium zg-997]